MGRSEDLEAMNLERVDDDDIDFAALFADPAADSDAFARWSDDLDVYVQRQGALDALRLRPRSEAPWPGDDNPMLSYLRERASEIVDDEGADKAIAWLAQEAWFEATIAERARVARVLTDDA